jgi:hypothetical protein
MILPGNAAGAVPYWGNVDWTVITGLLGAIGVFSSPFLLAWWNRRLTLPGAKALGAETTAERLTRQSAELYTQMERRAVNAEGEITRLDAEGEVLRAQVRGFESWAHWARHGWLNANAERVLLRRQIARIMRGESLTETFVSRMGHADPVRNPKPIPARERVSAEEPEQEETSDDTV